MKLSAVATLSAFLVCGPALAQFQDMPKGPVTIQVLDEAGNAVSGAQVHCVNWNFGPRFTELTPDEKAVTDLKGRVTFPERTIGMAFVRVQAGELGGWFRLSESGSDHPVNTVTVGVGRTLRVRTHVPGVLVVADGCLPVGFTDDDGELTLPNYGVGYSPDLAFTKEKYAWEVVSFSREISILDVQMKPGSVIEGVVLGPGGEPAPNVSVFGGAFRHNPVITDSAGCFQMPRSPRTEFGEKHQICASLRSGAGNYWAEVLVAVETPVISGLTLRLARSVPQVYTLRGRVIHAETGEPVKAQILKSTSDNLFCADHLGSTDDTGRFSIDVSQRGGFWYFAVSDDPTLFTIGSMIYVSEPKENAAIPELEFQVSKGCAITGRACSEDGAPIGNRWVYYEPDGDVTFPIETQKDGRFTVAHLNGAGESYRLSVHDAFGRRASVDVGPLNRGEVQEGVEIILPPQIEPAKLRGTVRDSAGNPVAGVRMRFDYVQPFDPPSVQSTTDDRGRFVATILYSGEATVTARSLTQQSPGEYSAYYDLPCGVPHPGKVILDTASDAEQNFVVTPLPDAKQ